jgi:hypothetical protein
VSRSSLLNSPATRHAYRHVTESQAAAEHEKAGEFSRAAECYTRAADACRDFGNAEGEAKYRGEAKRCAATCPACLTTTCHCADCGAPCTTS